MSSERADYRTHSSKLFLCGGGTGGHVYPALAVAAALQEHVARADAYNDDRRPTMGQGIEDRGSRIDPPSAADRHTRSSIFDLRQSVVYIGSVDGMEAGLVAQETDLPFRAIPAAALRGRSPLALASNLRTLAHGTRAARRLIAQEQPLAILGTGGYVCVPLFLAARAAGVPAAVYLPDVVPGLAVRFLARLSTAVACNVEDSIEHFGLQIADFRFPTTQSTINNLKSKMVITGYPVRRELFDQDRALCQAAFGLDGRLPVLFVYGGSRGARSINQAIESLLPHLLPIAQIIHVCGREGDESWLRAAAAQLPAELQARYRLYPYLFSDTQRVVVEGVEVAPGTQPCAPPTMVQAFGAADLALCRSGASTLGELPAAGLPAVLVPYPYVYQDENADYLVRRGAAIKVRDGEMLGDGRPDAGPLFQNLLRLIGDADERATMSERSKALAQPNAAGRLADLLLTLAISKRPTS
jgi:UDP-N-acetylglucosamine--N-acetylmuramyl-(pentapeptide) pyrophosphoryl-undecaprenol N-acetylglucosamine transferase